MRLLCHYKKHDKIIHEMPEQNYEKNKEIILKSLTLNIKYIKGNLK